MLQPKSYPLIGQEQLMRRMFAGDDLAHTAAQLIQASTESPNNAEALLDLSDVLILRGNRDVGLATLKQALKIKQHFRLQTQGKLRLLVLKTPGDFMANTPVEFLLNHKDIAVDVLYVAPNLPAPEHLDYDLIFVAVSEMDANLSVLSQLSQLLKTWQIPFINHPDEIPLLARDRACEILDTVPGVYMPQNIRVSRRDLTEIAQLQLQLRELLMQDRFPLLVRPVDSHAGNGLAQINQHEDIARYLTEQPESEFYLMPYADYRSNDGQFRKYRIVFIQGEAHLCHMAISDHWMVHYLNAGMTQDQLKREEEAINMLAFSQHLGLRQKQRLTDLAEAIHLDYFGIDCAETSDGQLLVFEVANAMVVHDMDPIDMFPYKKTVMNKVYEQFHQMLFNHAGANRLLTA